ncbi:MAG: ParA family protein [Deltaproteobacteria bacterium]|nr:MAG: ParA family protein [Deltaproteobacteria bacterium]
MPRLIAFINEKGGSAKTTLVANLGAYAALRRGHRVLGIDMDPQGHLGRVLGVPLRSPKRTAIDLLLDAALDRDPVLDRVNGDSTACRESVPIVSTRVPNFDLVVADKSLGLFASLAGNGEDVTARLQQSLRWAPEIAPYDWILIDSPPSFGPLTLNVLRAVEEIVIPVPLTYLGVNGCAQLTRTIEMVRKRYQRSALRISMVIPTFFRRTNLAHELLDRLKQRFPKEMGQTVVGYHVRIDEAQSYGLSIFEYAPGSSGAVAMAALAEELDLRGASLDGEAP